MSTGDAPATPELLSEYFQQYKVAVYDNLSNGIVYGAYIMVYLTSVYVLLSKPGFTSSPTRIFMFGITTFMFALGMIALVLVTAIGLWIMRNIFTSDGLPSSIENMYHAWGGVTCLMYILCDIVCAWRTVVLWNGDKRIIAVLVLFILGTIAAAGYALAINLVSLSPDEASLILGKLDLIMIGPTVATNLLTTGLIAWKAWQRRITVGKHLREGSGSVRIDRVFALLIESGLIYCCIWILYWISTMGLLPTPGLTLIAFVSGLYPTLIIILVSKQMSPVERYSTHSTEMQFMHAPALGPPRDGSPPRHVLTLRRDYTSDSDTQIPAAVFMKSSDEECNLLQ